LDEPPEPDEPPDPLDPKGSWPKMEPPEPELPEPELPEPELPEPELLEPELLEPELLDPVLPEEFPGLAPWALLLTKVRDGQAAWPMPSPTRPAIPTRAVAATTGRVRRGFGAGWASEAGGGAGGPGGTHHPPGPPAGGGGGGGDPGALGPHPDVAGGGHVWPWPP
jgi:hypothetical protein